MPQSPPCVVAAAWQGFFPWKNTNTLPQVILGLQWGSNGDQWGEMGEHNLGDVWAFSYIFNNILGFYGVYIVPKWLIKVPGPIAVLFG